MKVPYPNPQNKTQRVANGMAILDERLGPDWPLFIDLDTFDISNGDRCVLGQVFGPVVTVEELQEDGSPYDAGLTALFNYNGTVQDFAFAQEWDDQDLSLAMGMDGDSVDTQTWKRAIRKRQREYSSKQVAAVREWAVEHHAKTQTEFINTERKALDLGPITVEVYKRAVKMNEAFMLPYTDDPVERLDNVEAARLANAR